MRNGPYTLIIPPPEYSGRRYRGRYAYEHHVSVWRTTGEALKAGQVVHHKNGIKTDNRPANLEVLSAGSHRREHGQEKRAKSVISFCCGYCGKKRTVRGAVFRSRLKQSKFSKLFCSTKCGAYHQFRGARKDMGFTVNED